MCVCVCVNSKHCILAALITRQNRGDRWGSGWLNESFSNDRATKTKACVPAQQKSGARNRVQPPLVCMHALLLIIMYSEQAYL